MGKSPEKSLVGRGIHFDIAKHGENIYLDFATDKIQNSSIWKKNFDIMVVNRLRYWEILKDIWEKPDRTIEGDV